MEELVKFVAVSLVEKPDEVTVALKETESEYVIELKVAPEDMGKVIGKQGRIAKAIRAIVKAATMKSEKPYYVEIS